MLPPLTRTSDRLADLTTWSMASCADHARTYSALTFAVLSGCGKFSFTMSGISPANSWAYF
jgi:hypothetical protein